ncbi:MAG: alpha/beta hydrolase [Bacteroidota bacterium]
MDIAKIVGKTINGLVEVSPKLTGRLLLNLFCRPKEGRQYNSKDEAFLAKAEWKTLTLDGQKIQCYRWGESTKKVLLAHGFNSNAARWRLLTHLLLEEGFEVIALDVPAHGKSGWRRVNGILYAQVLSKVISTYRPDFLVGHSFAGIATGYYLTQMEAIFPKKIVLMGVPNELDQIAEVFFTVLGVKEKAKAAYFQSFEDIYGYPSSYFTLANMFQQVAVPGLVIHDEQDDIAAFEGAKVIHQKWANSQFLATKNLGHSLQGKTVYSAIKDFLGA